MDFLTTARLLMDIQKAHPLMRYDFNDLDGTIQISIPIAEGVANDFELATKMFEVVE